MGIFGVEKIFQRKRRGRRDGGAKIDEEGDTFLFLLKI